MDRIIKITLSVFVVVLVIFTGAVGYSVFKENAYRTSLTGTYTYNCTISTDSVLGNVTLFLPVPADMNGNSPIVALYSGKQITGVPDTWVTTLYDTGKATLVKVTIPSVIPPDGTTTAHPYVVTLSASTSSRTRIDTRNPVVNSSMFRPITDLTPAECRDTVPPADNRQCATYLTSLYADYQASPNATVSITAALRGENNWNIFGPTENAYTTQIYIMMQGENHGWATVRGYLEKGIGYDDPSL